MAGRINAIIQGVLEPLGLRLTRIQRPEHNALADNERLELNDFLDRVLPAIEANEYTGKWPTPTKIREYFTPNRIAFYHSVLDLCDKEKITIDHRTVIDIGCHAGYLLHLVANRYETTALFGADVVDDMLVLTKAACPNASVLKTTVWDLPTDQHFQVMFMTEVLEHLAYPEKALHRLLTACADDGCVVITVPDGRKDQFPAKQFNPHLGSYAGHINFWSPESWRYFFERLFGPDRVRTGALGANKLYAVIRRTDLLT